MTKSWGDVTSHDQVWYERPLFYKYDLQIKQHNVCYINIIAIKDVISEKKDKEKEILIEGIANITVPAEMA